MTLTPLSVSLINRDSQRGFLEFFAQQHSENKPFNWLKNRSEQSLTVVRPKIISCCASADT